MASSRHNAGNFPSSVETLPQRIMASLQPQVQRRLMTEQDKIAQQRVKAIEECMLKYSITEELPKDLLECIQDTRKAINLGNISDFLEDSLDSWKKLPLNIAVTGQSGSGKSTFINTVRGLAAFHEGAAKIGTTEQTTKPHSYSHPDNRNLLLWDLPGVGTPKFPRDTYLKDTGFERFDCYIIMTSVRFTDNDLWLAEKIASNKKKFYFIRGKFDNDRDNEQEDSAESFDEKKLLEKIKQDCQEHLTYAGFENAPVFIISNRLKHKDKWDFPVAIEKITTDFPENKQKAILLSLNNLSALTQKMLELKKKYLAERNWSVSLLAALGGIFPLPGFNVLVDYNIIADEKAFYYKQFGLSDKTVEEHETKVMTSLRQGMSNEQAGGWEYIVLKLSAIAEKHLFNQSLFPEAKMATTTLTSYKLVSDTLEKILEEYAELAEQEIRKMVEDAGNHL